MCACIVSPPYDQEFIAQLNRDHGTVCCTAVLEIVVNHLPI